MLLATISSVLLLATANAQLDRRSDDARSLIPRSQSHDFEFLMKTTEVTTMFLKDTGLPGLDLDIPPRPWDVCVAALRLYRLHDGVDTVRRCGVDFQGSCDTSCRGYEINIGGCADNFFIAIEG
ncbi:hypothetical protein CDD80_3104 [Ophiocordyceps camponoti-rufipedis]|uniref:Uncharacterized protein n=1 Tax=Ophiocordyceps camponoti-rufipedis TaxID=2004952 RepID=A0A2C5XJ89_9HYPO|nr:hypothetical protein CDD80_3104 [Ophiocordyceps camponoti-rufipedis]